MVAEILEVQLLCSTTSRKPEERIQKQAEDQKSRKDTARTNGIVARRMGRRIHLEATGRTEQGC